MDKAKEIEGQYDKIYRYCYFKLQKREIAEDITQETFLRFWESRDYHSEGKALRYLYTIARNLCIDEYRKKKYRGLAEEFDETKDTGNSSPHGADTDMEEKVITSMTVRAALDELDEEERELVILRYVNEVPISVICSLHRMSRFSCYRKLKRILKVLEEKLGDGKAAEVKGKKDCYGKEE